jgi:hypothetical protein
VPYIRTSVIGSHSAERIARSRPRCTQRRCCGPAPGTRTKAATMKRNRRSEVFYVYELASFFPFPVSFNEYHKRYRIYIKEGNIP